MTAPADILYLPILTPARIEASPPLAHSFNAGTGEQTWRQRLHQVQAQPRPTQGMIYGPDGRMAIDTSGGGIIDIFA